MCIRDRYSTQHQLRCRLFASVRCQKRGVSLCRQRWSPAHWIPCWLSWFKNITTMIDSSLRQGRLLDFQKRLLVMPMANFRPVSNLSFVSKVVEKVVSWQLNEHLNGRSLLPRHQLAYRKYRSTETAIGSWPPAVEWSRDWWRHVTPKRSSSWPHYRWGAISSQQCKIDAWWRWTIYSKALVTN